MTDSTVALSVIFVVVAISTVVALLASRRIKMDLEQWSVAGRGFGVIFVWLLMAGEIYTTFAFLGASGWAYSRGGPALYIITYLTLAYAVSFFILPQLWEYGKKHGIQTQSDFFQARYGSKYLAAAVALIGIIFIIPYIQLQLTGLGIIMETTSYGGISKAWAMFIAFGLVAIFMFTSGIRAIAWVGVIKDVLLLSAAVFLGIALPYIYFGGIGEMFTQLAHAKLPHLTLPGSTTNMGFGWYITTVLLTSLGFYMWPHQVPSTMTAKSGDTLRRNACFMPLYSITIPFIFFVGFTAILVVPGLTNGDMALLTLVRKTFSPWFLGLIGAAGCLTAMLPAAALLQTSAMLFAKNFYRPVFAPDMTDDSLVKLSKVVVIILTVISLYLALYSSVSLVALLLLGYSGVTQFFPGIVLGLYWKRINLISASVGIAVGESIVACLVLNKMDPFMGLNAGFVALAANLIVTILVSYMTASSADSVAKGGAVT
jgi:solute:Na+ symporter, SSS family